MTVCCSSRPETLLVHTCFFVVDSVSAKAALLALLILVMLTLALVASGDARSVLPAASLLRHQIQQSLIGPITLFFLEFVCGRLEVKTEPCSETGCEVT